MVNKCAAVSCQSGYAEQSSLPHKSDPSPSTTFHKFTMDEVLRERWIHANSRENQAPSKYSKVCSLHFHKYDFETVHRNTNKTRTNVTQWTMTRTKQYAAENKPVMSSVLEKRCNSFSVSQFSCLFVAKRKTSEVCTHDIGFASLNSSDSSRE